jgi:broad specificity phosphatase PhoE
VTTQVLLVRHGESTGNADRIWQGLLDAPLTSLCEAQARAAAAAVGAVDAIVASSLERSWRTAEIVAEEIGVGPVVIEADLRERDLGAWTGLTTSAIKERWPDVVIREADPEAGESRPAVLARALAALHRLADGYDGGHVLAVSHGGVIRFLERHLGFDAEPVPNLGGRHFIVDGDTLRAGDRVLLVD